MVKGLLGLGRADRVYGLITNLGTSDAFFNSWLPSGQPRHSARSLATGKEAYLTELAASVGGWVLDTGCGHPHYNPRYFSYSLFVLSRAWGPHFSRSPKEDFREF